jgi:hypothetical protein
MLRGKTVATRGDNDDDNGHVVQPSDPLAVFEFGVDNKGNEEGDSGGDRGPSGHRHRRTLLCGVWGTVLEVNPNLSPDLLRKDPDLDGYVAVVLPTGPFPPPPPPPRRATARVAGNSNDVGSCGGSLGGDQVR